MAFEEVIEANRRGTWTITEEVLVEMCSEATTQELARPFFIKTENAA